MDYLTQISNTTGEVVSGAFNTTGEVVGSAFNWVVEHPKVVVATGFVIGALIYGVTVSASTFGFGVSTAIPVITSAFLYLSSRIEDNDERNIK
ncbi:hypothetical protein [Streptococcus mitis]|uniref:Uncharacterized protein n=1 Tax=Streptococcus mitis TaxID=28037 RepID=A0A3R9IVZ1_STRMT|nr:hypothetical protein [Streptococcus mitis]RSI91765.1 hypothetical protein D8845_06510 [Streptococcus mitis]